MHAKMLQSCPTLFDPMEVAHQASLSMRLSRQKILEWVSMPSSRGSPHPGIESAISYISLIGRQVLYH